MSAKCKPELTAAITKREIEPLAHRFVDAYRRALKAETKGRVGLRHALREKPQLLDTSPSHLEWIDLSLTEQHEPGAGFEVYEHIKQKAHDYLESGERGADLVANGLMRPWVKASYLALRDSLIADWQPTGSMEMRLIDMMAQLYTAYEHWMELAVQHVAIQCQEESQQIEYRGKWRPTGINENADA